MSCKQGKRDNLMEIVGCYNFRVKFTVVNAKQLFLCWACQHCAICDYCIVLHMKDRYSEIDSENDAQ